MSSSSVPPHLTPTSRFSNRAALYAQYRPTWPSHRLIPFFLTETTLGDAIRSTHEVVTVADIGSGTGISSCVFLESDMLKNELEKSGKRMEVIGVEPNGEMR